MEATFLDNILEVVIDPDYPDKTKTLDQLLIQFHISDTLKPVRPATEEDKIAYAQAYADYLVAKKK